MLPIGNDFDVKVSALKRNADGTFINDAVLSVTMKDAAGDNVTGAVDISLTYETGSSGNYRGTIAGTVALVDGAKYTLEITADNYNFKTQLIDRAGVRGET